MLLCRLMLLGFLSITFPSQALVTMTPDQRRESITLSQLNLLAKEEKTRAYTLEEFSYDFFRCFLRICPNRSCFFVDILPCSHSCVFIGLILKTLSAW